MGLLISLTQTVTYKYIWILTQRIVQMLDDIAEKFFGVKRRNPMQGIFGDIFKVITFIFTAIFLYPLDVFNHIVGLNECIDIKINASKIDSWVWLVLHQKIEWNIPFEISIKMHFSSRFSFQILTLFCRWCEQRLDNSFNVLLSTLGGNALVLSLSGVIDLFNTCVLFSLFFSSFVISFFSVTWTSSCNSVRLDFGFTISVSYYGINLLSLDFLFHL